MNPDCVQLTNTEELYKLSKYAADKKEKMQNLSKEWADIGLWSRMSDSKASEKDKAICYFSSLKKSDNDAILEQIRDYQNFYEEISAFALEITRSEEVNCENLRRKIFLLKKRLSEVYELAKREEQEILSKAICNMHKSFIEEYETLNWIVKDFENAALSEMLTAAQNGWRKTLGELTILREEFQNIRNNYTDVCENFYALKNEHE